MTLGGRLRGLVDAGVVDEHVRGAELGDPVANGLERGPIGHVALLEPAGRVQLAVAGSDVDPNHPRTGAREGAHPDRAELPERAGDDGQRIFERPLI